MPLPSGPRQYSAMAFVRDGFLSAHFASLSTTRRSIVALNGVLGAPSAMLARKSRNRILQCILRSEVLRYCRIDAVVDTDRVSI